MLSVFQQVLKNQLVLPILNVMFPVMCETYDEEDDEENDVESQRPSQIASQVCLICPDIYFSPFSGKFLHLLTFRLYLSFQWLIFIDSITLFIHISDLRKLLILGLLVIKKSPIYNKHLNSCIF